MGITGLETAFPVLYTRLVRRGVLSLEALVRLMSENPRRRFGLGPSDDFCVWELGAEYGIDPDKFISMGKSTPFAGERVFGRNLINVCGGKAVWKLGQTE